MRPADGDYIQVAVTIDVNGLRTLVMLVAFVDHMDRPGSAGAIRIFEDQQTTILRLRWRVLAGNDVHVAIAVHIGRIDAQGVVIEPPGPGDLILLPNAGSRMFLLIPVEHFAFAAGQDIQLPITIDIRELASMND